MLVTYPKFSTSALSFDTSVSYVAMDRDIVATALDQFDWL